MLLMNGRKMSKSDGNTITPPQLFSGDSEHISKSYTPMVIRFFMLQSHYRSTLDLTDEALLAAEKGYKRLMEANKILHAMSHPSGGSAGTLDKEVKELMNGAFEEMNDDFNTPKALAKLFELVTKVNGLKAGHLSFSELTAETLDQLKKTFHTLIFTIFGLKDDLQVASAAGNGKMDGLMQLVIEMRANARANKDWGTSDKIRDTLKELKIQLKDGKEGTSWTVD